MATEDGETKQVGFITFAYDANENEWVPYNVWEARRLQGPELEEEDISRCRDSLYLFNCYPGIMRTIASATPEEASAFLDRLWNQGSGIYTLEHFFTWPMYLQNWFEIVLTLLLSSGERTDLLPTSQSLQYEEVDYEAVILHKKLSLDIMFLAPLSWDTFESLNFAAWSELGESGIADKIVEHTLLWALLATVYLFVDISMVAAVIYAGYWASGVLYVYAGNFFV